MRDVEDGDEGGEIDGAECEGWMGDGAAVTSLRKIKKRLVRWEHWAMKVGPSYYCGPAWLRLYDRYARVWNDREYQRHLRKESDE